MHLAPAWHTHKPHAIQEAMWKAAWDGIRFIFAVAGRGSGKTELARRFLVMQLAQPKPWHDPRYFYGAPTRDQAKRISWDKIKSLVPPSWVAGEPNETALVIKTKWGSELRVVGLDKPERIEGDQWDGGVLDESCDLKPKVFSLNVAGMLSWRNGFCWRIGVPKRSGPGVAEFRIAFEEALAGKRPDSAAFSWSAETVLSPDQLRFALTHLDPKDYAEQIGGAFQDIGGGIYYTFSRTENVRPCTYDPTLCLYICTDFNVNPMAWVFVQDHGTHLEVVDEIWEEDCYTEDALRIAWNRYQYHRGGIAFHGDAASSQRHTAAALSDYDQICLHPGFKTARATVNYPLSNPPILDRYAAVNAMLCNAAGERRLFIDPRCEHLINDFQLVSYKPGTREPIKGQTLLHPTDAIGYYIEQVFPLTVDLDLEMQDVSAQGAA